jgi:N-acylneuraminate cytidylyltransferase
VSENFAFIPARAGSKGVINKNLRNIGSFNLLELSILSALQSEIFTKIYVSSNGHEILDCAKNIAKNANASNIVQCVVRPDYLSEDGSTTESAMEHLFGQIECSDFDRFYILQPTSVFRHQDLIYNFYKNFEESGCHSGFTANAVTPFLWNRGNPQYDILKRKMRQDLSSDELFYHEDGNIFAFQHYVFKSLSNRLDANPFIYETNDIQSLQIDTEFDLDYCSYICEKDVGVVEWTNSLARLLQR